MIRCGCSRWRWSVQHTCSSRAARASTAMRLAGSSLRRASAGRAQHHPRHSRRGGFSGPPRSGHLLVGSDGAGKHVGREHRGKRVFFNSAPRARCRPRVRSEAPPVPSSGGLWCGGQRCMAISARRACRGRGGHAAPTDRKGLVVGPGHKAGWTCSLTMPHGRGAERRARRERGCDRRARWARRRRRRLPGRQRLGPTILSDVTLDDLQNRPRRPAGHDRRHAGRGHRPGQHNPYGNGTAVFTRSGAATQVHARIDVGHGINLPIRCRCRCSRSPARADRSSATTTSGKAPSPSTHSGRRSPQLEVRRSIDGSKALDGVPPMRDHVSSLLPFLMCETV